MSENQAFLKFSGGIEIKLKGTLAHPACDVVATSQLGLI